MMTDYDGLRRITTDYDGLRRITTDYDKFRRITTDYDGLRRIKTDYDGLRRMTTTTTTTTWAWPKSRRGLKKWAWPTPMWRRFWTQHPWANPQCSPSEYAAHENEHQLSFMGSPTAQYQ